MSNDKLKLAIFISGRGSNMKSLVDACRNSEIPAEVSVVVSNVPDAPGLDYASAQGLYTAVVDHKKYDAREAFEDALIAELSEHEIDLVCLAGFMRVLTPHFLARLNVPIINIHPSLLPKYKGLNTHQRAIDAGDTIAGCSVHYVVPDIDSGEILVQKTVAVKPDDTAVTLAERVLEQEHIAYPEAVKIIADKLQKGMQ